MRLTQFYSVHFTRADGLPEEVYMHSDKDAAISHMHHYMSDGFGFYTDAYVMDETTGEVYPYEAN